MTKISLSIFFCSVHLHRFKGVDGGSGERWWEFRIFSPRPHPGELRHGGGVCVPVLETGLVLGAVCAHPGQPKSHQGKARWKDGGEHFLDGGDGKRHSLSQTM